MIRITAEMIEESRGDESAFRRAVEAEYESWLAKLARDLERDLLELSGTDQDPDLWVDEGL